MGMEMIAIKTRLCLEIITILSWVFAYFFPRIFTSLSTRSLEAVEWDGPMLK